MLRHSAAVLLATLLLAGCGGNSIKNKENVQEAILKRLQSSSGLDLKALDVTTTDVSFRNNFAYATVAFHPKNDTSLNSGMTMKYTLEDRGGKWVVVKAGDSRRHQVGGGTDQLPPGHPPVGQQGASEQAQ